jgi:hypothetical protein
VTWPSWSIPFFNLAHHALEGILYSRATGKPAKNWKFKVADVAEREFWDDYMTAYEKCISATSAVHTPCYVGPADDKENARLIVSQIIIETFEGMKMSYPKSSADKLKCPSSYGRHMPDRCSSILSDLCRRRHVECGMQRVFVQLH